MRKQKISAARGAQRRRANICCRHSGVEQLATVGFHQDDRQTISRPYAQQHPRSFRKQTIACELFLGTLVHAMNEIRVDLPQRDQWPWLAILHESKFAEKSSSIALHRIARILFRKP